MSIYMYFRMNRNSLSCEQLFAHWPRLCKHTLPGCSKAKEGHQQLCLGLGGGILCGICFFITLVSGLIDVLGCIYCLFSRIIIVQHFTISCIYELHTFRLSRSGLES